MSQISALKRIQTKEEQQICQKFSQIILNKDNIIQVYIGRDIDCNYRISSIEISRKHALIEYSIEDHFWTISDLRSTNGLFVNTVQLSSYSPHRLSNGDRVSFGPPNQSQFNYQFISNYSQNSSNCVSYELSAINLTSIPVIPIVTRIETNSSNDQILSSSLRFDIESNQSSTISLTTNMPTRSGANYSVATTRSPRMSVSTTCTAVSTGPHKVFVSSRKNRDSNERQVLSGFVEHDYSRSTGTKDTDRNGKSSRRLKLKDNGSGSSSSKWKEEERKGILKEKEKLEKMKRSLELMDQKRKIKIKHKEEVLKKKQKDLERKELESKKKLEEIERLKRELSRKKKELSERRNQLSDESSENVTKVSAKRKLRSDSLRESATPKRQCSTGEEFGKKFEDLFGSDMTCSICAEYFLQAVNLNCSHTFCFACIEEWKHNSRNGSAECPICREKIETQTRELVFDNIIDSFVAEYKPHLKEHRKTLVEERKKKLEKKKDDHENRASGANRGRLSSLIPSLHFFVRRHPHPTNDDSDSEDDSGDDNIGIFGLNFGDDSIMNSSSAISSISSSDDSSSSDSDDSDSSSSSSDSSIVSLHSIRSNRSHRDFDVSPFLSTSSLSTTDRDQDFDDNNSGDSYVSLHSVRTNTSNSSVSSDSDVESVVDISEAQELDSDSNDSSDDSDFSVD